MTVIPAYAGQETQVMYSEAELEGGALGGAINLMENKENWRTNEWVFQGGFEWDGDAIYVTDAAPDKPRGAFTQLRLDQTEPTPVTITGEAKGVGIPGAPDVEFSIWADVHYTDGTAGWGLGIAPFPTDSSDWEYVEMYLSPPKPIATIDLFLLLRRKGEAAWFRNVTYKEHTGHGTFDQEMAEPIASTAQAETVATLSAENLQLDIAADGRIAAVRGEGIDIGSDGYGGFMIKDVFAGSGYYAGATQVTPSDDGVHITSSYPTLGLDLSATLLERDGYIEVQGQVVDVTGQDRGLVVYFTLPIRHQGWTWWQDISHSVPVQAMREYHNVTSVQAGSLNAISRYPVAALTGPSGLAMATAGDEPRLARLGYSAATEQFYIAYDIGLAPDTKTPSSADFTFYIYGIDREWGFRSAWERYMQIESDLFAVHVPTQGIWMPFSSIAEVEGWQDFGFGVHELASIDQAEFAREHGILSFIYEEPHTYWMPMPVPLEQRTPERVLSMLQAEQQVLQKEIAYATEVSAIHDANGNMRSLAMDAPWNRGVVFTLNPDPELPGKDGKPNRGQVAFNPDNPDLERVSGQYFDSIEVRHDTALANFRRDHFPYADYPLVYDRKEQKPAILHATSVYEFLKWAKGELEQKGKFMMLNSTPYKFWWFTMLADISGTEASWLTGDGTFSPPTDADMVYIRTLSGQKPYVLLQNVRFELTDTKFVEEYFKRSLFYGIYPSMFSHDAASDPYWANPKFYNRDRELFKKYIPVITEVASAGWQPVTEATTFAGGVRVERFGTGDRTYFTLYNFAEQRRNVRLTVPLDRLGIPTDVVAYDMLTGEPITGSSFGQQLTLRLNMEPDEVKVIRFSVK